MKMLKSVPQISQSGGRRQYNISRPRHDASNACLKSKKKEKEMTPVRFGRTSPKQVYMPRNSLPLIKTLPLPNEIRKQTPWPSGLRRRIKVPVRKGVSSNLTGHPVKKKIQCELGL